MSQQQFRELRTFFNVVGKTFMDVSEYESKMMIVFDKFYESEIDAIIAIKPLEENQRLLKRRDIHYSITPVLMINMADSPGDSPGSWHVIDIAKLNTNIEPTVVKDPIERVSAFGIVNAHDYDKTVRKCFKNKNDAENEAKIANEYRLKSGFNYWTIVTLDLIKMPGTTTQSETFYDINLRCNVPTPI